MVRCACTSTACSRSRRLLTHMRTSRAGGRSVASCCPRRAPQPMSAFVDLAAIPAQQLSPGYLARVIHGSRVTFAVVEIEPNAELPEHSHENEQLGIVLRGYSSSSRKRSTDGPAGHEPPRQRW